MEHISIKVNTELQENYVLPEIGKRTPNTKTTIPPRRQIMKQHPIRRSTRLTTGWSTLNLETWGPALLANANMVIPIPIATTPKNILNGWKKLNRNFQTLAKINYDI